MSILDCRRRSRFCAVAFMGARIKMIIYDADEAKHLPMPPGWKSHAQLEEWTGADYLVSPLSLPYHSEIMLGKHLKAGAFLVQRKSGRDLVNSIKDTGNLWDMLDRMLTFCKKYHPHARPSQRVVLGLGLFYGVKDDALMINRKQAEYCNYWQLQGAIERIFERDCCFVNVAAGPEALYKWLRTKELHTLDNQKHPIKHAIVRPARMTDVVDSAVLDELTHKPLQQLVTIRDQRITLVTFPGMGENKVNAVWEYAQQNLARALTLITDPLLVKSNDKPSGVALGLIQAWREWLGLQEGEFLLINRLKQSPPVSKD